MLYILEYVLVLRKGRYPFLRVLIFRIVFLKRTTKNYIIFYKVSEVLLKSKMIESGRE